MKVNWYKIKTIALWIVGILAFLIIIGFFRHLVLPFQVEQVELHTYDHKTSSQRVLSDTESRILINLYNLSRDSGEITAESCCDSYGFYIDYKDGNRQYIGDGEGDFLIKGENGRTLQNPLLLHYVYYLAQKYDMPIE